MNSPSGFPILHRDGDSFFNYEIGGSTYQVQVTHECLADTFGSEGGIDNDEGALLDNLQAIVDVATKKVASGATSPVQVTQSDF
jgi:hypothetical protein